MYRQFHAEIEIYAPKDRTLFNYNIKDGFKPVKDFLGLDIETGKDGNEFPHINKTTLESSTKLAGTITSHGKFKDEYAKEVLEYLAKFGITHENLVTNEK